jgi:hypothetical protein
VAGKTCSALVSTLLSRNPRLRGLFWFLTLSSRTQPRFLQMAVRDLLLSCLGFMDVGPAVGLNVAPGPSARHLASRLCSAVPGRSNSRALGRGHEVTAKTRLRTCLYAVIPKSASSRAVLVFNVVIPNPAAFSADGGEGPAVVVPWVYGRRARRGFKCSAGAFSPASCLCARDAPCCSQCQMLL